MDFLFFNSYNENSFEPEGSAAAAASGDIEKRVKE